MENPSAFAIQKDWIYKHPAPPTKKNKLKKMVHPGE